MKVKRLLYLGYYLKQLNWRLFFEFVAHASRESGKSKLLLILDAVWSVFRYNISLLEYFQFRFYKLCHAERLLWAGTGFMYEFQLRMNPPDKRNILDDKTLFFKFYSDFFIHRVADLGELESKEIVASVLNNKSGKIVFKVADGKCGKQVLVRKVSDFTEEKLTSFMREHGYDLVEEFIVQHPDINRLSPSAVNTVRIFTQLDDNNQVEFLGCRLRISVNSPVDNLAAGNLAAPIDEQTGVVTGPGVYSDIRKADEPVHPVTHEKITGFQIPFWEEVKTLAIKAARANPQNRSIGWDIVVTENGPGLIEGNHDWCKLLWQLPVKQGLKSRLTRYLN
jgi:hypothetical protein